MHSATRPHGSMVADFNVPPPGIPYIVCYFDGDHASFFRYGTRYATFTSPVHIGSLVSRDIDPESARYLLKDRRGHPFRWRNMGGTTRSEIEHAFAFDLGADLCGTEDEFEAMVERMMAADPLREHRFMAS